MWGGIKITWSLVLLQLLIACSYTSYEEKVNLYQVSPMRSVVILPFINYSGVVNAATEVNNIFVAEFRKHHFERVLGKRAVYAYLRKRGLKKRPIFDRRIALTLGRLFKVDSVIYGSILSFMKPGMQTGSNRYVSLAMNIRVIDIKSGKIVKASAISKDVTPSLWTNTRAKFQRVLNNSVSDMVSDLLEGGVTWE